MPMKKHKPQQIVALLRQIEVEIANGTNTIEWTGFPTHSPTHSTACLVRLKGILAVPAIL